MDPKADRPAAADTPPAADGERERLLARLAEGEERQAYLVGLSDALRPLSDPLEVQAVATRTLGAHLRANRVLFFEVDGADYVVERDYTDGAASLAGRYPVASFGAELYAAFLAGRPVVEADATAAEGRAAAERAAFAAIAVRGHVDVPLVKGGRFVAGMTVHSRTPRGWTAAEVALIGETAERTWAAAERARAERALRASEEKYRALFDTMDEGFCVIEVEFDAAGRAADYRHVEANPAFGRHTGMADFLGRSTRGLFPGLEEFWFETYGRVAASGVPTRFEHRAEPLGRWFDVNAFRLGGPGSRRVAVLFADTTARKAAEDALRASEERFRTLFDSMDQGFCVIEVLPDRGGRAADFRFAEMNPAFDRHTGLSGVVGKSIREAVPGLEEFWFETYGRVAATGEPARFEHRAEPLGRWFEVYAFRLRDAVGHRVGVLFTDITARKRDEEAIRASNEFNRSLMDASADCIKVLDGGGRLMHMNGPGLCAMEIDNFGPLCGRRWPELWPENAGHRLERAVAGAAAGSVVNFEGFCPTAKGTPRWWDVTVSPVRDRPDGPVVRLLAVSRDITARKRDEEDRERLMGELREQDRRKDEFLATLAHELRNPLAPIRNALQVARHAPPGSAAAARGHDIMERQVAQMVRLIDDLLEVSRISQGKIALQREQVALAAVVASAVEASGPLVESCGHELAVAPVPAGVVLDADPTRLAQVFLNLLNNAAKYTERGGRIAVTSRFEGRFAVVTVADTGVGIAPDMLPRVFDLFTQVDRSLEKAQGGLGIGLSLVKRLVELHGGTVEARSEGVPGRGSEFVVRLPAAKEESGKAEEEPAAGPASPVRLPPSALRILIADDNRDAAESLATLLEILGHQVRTADDGAAAVEAAAAFGPEVVLLDIGMPRLNGYDACRRIRELPGGRGLVMVALTGWGQEGDRLRSAEAGFDHHLVKPVELAAVEAILKQASRGPSGPGWPNPTGA